MVFVSEVNLRETGGGVSFFYTCPVPRHFREMGHTLASGEGVRRYGEDFMSSAAIRGLYENVVKTRIR